MAKFPAHLGPARKFSREKRKHMRLVLRAMQELSAGSAYFPDGGYEDFKQAQAILERLAVKMSPKKWGA